MQINDHNLLELKLNLSDVTFQGTENFIRDIGSVINKIQVRSDTKWLSKNSFSYCISTNTSCPSTIQTSVSEIYNQLVEMHYYGYHTMNEMERE